MSACVVLIGGCAAHRPQTAPAEARAPTPLELRAFLRERDRALASFQGQGRLEYEGPDGRLRSASMIVVRAPDKVRIDFRSPFSLTYTVVTDGRHLIAYDRGEKVLYYGRPSPENFGRYTRVPVELRMLVALVRGLPPLPDGNKAGTIVRVEDGWRWDAPLAGSGVITIVVDPYDWRPLRVAVSGSTEGDIVAYFEDYKDVGGVLAAHRVRTGLPDGGEVELVYGTIWRNRTHTDAAFRLQPPAGVRVVDMDAG